MLEDKVVVSYKKNFLYVLFFWSSFLFFSCNCEKIAIEEALTVAEQTIEQFSITQTAEGKLKMILEAEFAVVDEKGSVAHLQCPMVKFYDNGNYVSTLIMENADINLETYDVSGIGKCKIDGANNEHLETTDLMYRSKGNLIYSDNDVTIKKPGQIVHGTRFNADTKLETISVENQKTILS
jgi:LPS export ABC transporter protein LptC